MTTGPGQALAQALALLRAPRSARPGLDQRLPEGVFLLLRLVAGEEQALATAREDFVEPPEQLREAAAFFVQQVLFSPDADSYRVLGVDPDASDEKIREHFRWMARWLHPDRNRDEWEAFYADRVNQAWNNLRTPEKRQRYDSERRAVEHEPASPARVPIRVHHRAEPEQVENGMSLRWLPAAVLGSLAVLAVLGVVAFSLLRYAESNQQVASAEDPGEQPEVPAALRELEEGTSAPAVSIPASVDSGPIASAPVTTPTPPVMAPPAPIAPTPVPAPTPMPIAAAPVRPAPVPAAIPPRARGRVPTPAAAEAVARPMNVAVVLSPQAQEHSPAQPAAPEPGAAVVQVAAPAPAPIPPPAGISDRTANQILGNFSRAYSDGDLSGMRTMFTGDATGPGGNLASIMSTYGRVFGSSSDRSLDVSNVSWWTSGATLTIVASYQASVSASPNATPRRTHGDLRLDLRKQGDQWKIFRLRHDERPG